jgi:hypothetical protein
MEVSDAFWDRWIAADELEKVSIIETLPIVTSSRVPPFLKRPTATIVNSYLLDLYGYIIRKGIKSVSSSDNQQAHKQGYPFNSCTD